MEKYGPLVSGSKEYAEPRRVLPERDKSSVGLLKKISSSPGLSSGRISGLMYLLVRKSSRGLRTAVEELARLFNAGAGDVEEASEKLAYLPSIGDSSLV